MKRDLHCEQPALTALLATPRALRWLGASCQVSLLHRFERACNLVNEHGEVLSLVTSPAAMGPFSVLVDQIPSVSTDSWMIKSNEAGRRASLLDAPAEPSTLGFGARHIVTLGQAVVDLRRAQIWQPRPDWDMLRAAWSKHMERIIDLNALVHSCSPQGSLVDMLPFSSPVHTLDAVPGVGPGDCFIVGEVEGSLVQSIRLLRRSAPRNDTRQEELLRVCAPRNAMWQESLLRLATDSARILCAGIFNYDSDAISQAASQLAGLGGGLTPAGDDFLLGAMCAAWLVTPARQAEEIGSAIVRRASGRTTSLSSAWLSAAARGEFGAPWHDLLNSLVSRDPVDLEKVARVILDSGHTSGADALAGFLAVAYESYRCPR